jgi:hypothetical protein
MKTKLSTYRQRLNLFNRWENEQLKSKTVEEKLRQFEILYTLILDQFSKTEIEMARQRHLDHLITVQQRIKSVHRNDSLHPFQIEIFQRMSPWEKFSLAEKLFEDAKQIKKASLRKKHPSWSEAQLNQAVIDIFIYGKYLSI